MAIPLTALRTRVKKAVLLLATGFLLASVFVIDIIRKSVDLDSGALTFFRNAGVVVAFSLLTLLLESMWKRDQGPAKKLGFALVLSLVVGVAILLVSLISTGDFDAKSSLLIPTGFDSIVVAAIVGLLLGTMMLMVLMLLRDILMFKRRKGSRRNFLILLSLMLATALSTLALRPLESSLVTTGLFALSVAAMALNSFRLSWIVYLSKREKMFSMIYGFLLFGIFMGFDVALMGGSGIGRALLFYSRQLSSFIVMVSVFSTIYFGMTFLSTLFHLPTAEAFDRKISEVASLHNLSRLVTQVFDFNELVDSVTRMTLDVCQAKSSWLEIISVAQGRGGLGTVRVPAAAVIETVALKNITEPEARTIVSSNGESLRNLVIVSRKPVVIDDVVSDRRTRHLNEQSTKFGSLVIVPLVSHQDVIGILYATKDMSYGFDQEDVDVISAFADQATIAIENSRLIEKSLERERLVREMTVAQDMQKKLLPQSLPAYPGVEVEALSTPAFEVGGDYYDFALLDDRRLGVIVGDVSGKGVSASFYMAEMKGIFQSLSRIYASPREFLSKAHEALAGTIDRRSFISVIYAVLDVRDGALTLARAGHCPMLHVTRGTAAYVQPTGLGLGMGSTRFFEQTIVEERLLLGAGDVVVFFTDGVTEARPEQGEEFGYDRLLDVVRGAGGKSALEIRDAIIMAVDAHMGHKPPEDDLTLVVVKRIGN